MALRERHVLRLAQNLSQSEESELNLPHDRVTPPRLGSLRHYSNSAMLATLHTGVMPVPTACMGYATGYSTKSRLTRYEDALLSTATKYRIYALRSKSRKMVGSLVSRQRSCSKELQLALTIFASLWSMCSEKVKRLTICGTTGLRSRVHNLSSMRRSLQRSHFQIRCSRPTCPRRRITSQTGRATIILPSIPRNTV